MNDDDLFRKCKKRDPQAQKALFDKYSDRFYRMAIRYLKNTQEAEDVVMLTFVRIFEKVEKFTYQGSKAFESWMYKILINEALMALRRRYNFHLTETLEIENPDHECQFLQDADGDYLYQMILELPHGYRTVFNLYAVEGYDHNEIAQLLGIAESTSRSQLFKAKQLLKKKIHQEGFQYGT